MSVLMEQHRTWEAARDRLWYGKTPEPKKAKPRPTSPFKRLPRRPRWAKLFVRPIDELDDEGNVVIHNLFIPQWKRIALEVCDKHRISFNEIISPRRDKMIVAARHEAFWRCRNETALSYPQIGRKFGGRDHTTVLWGIRQHDRRMRESVDG